MNDTLISTPFELCGNFGGFVFTAAGKRRMLLRQGDQEYLLKVPRILRRRIIGKFRPDEVIRVAGTEEGDPADGPLKRIVSQVLPDTAGTPLASPPLHPATVVACPIRVCSKKNCWRKGGHELWKALSHELENRVLADQVELRQVGCLDRCKHAPNVDWGSHAYADCSPRDAATIVGRTAGALSPVLTLK